MVQVSDQNYTQKATGSSGQKHLCEEVGAMNPSISLQAAAQ
jgi:hypothetical protein